MKKENTLDAEIQKSGYTIITKEISNKLNVKIENWIQWISNKVANNVICSRFFPVSSLFTYWITIQNSLLYHEVISIYNLYLFR